jgi:hypothetical protein
MIVGYAFRDYHPGDFATHLITTLLFGIPAMYFGVDQLLDYYFVQRHCICGRSDEGYFYNAVDKFGVVRVRCRSSMFWHTLFYGSDGKPLRAIGFPYIDKVSNKDALASITHEHLGFLDSCVIAFDLSASGEALLKLSPCIVFLGQGETWTTYQAKSVCLSVASSSKVVTSRFDSNARVWSAHDASQLAEVCRVGLDGGTFSIEGYGHPCDWMRIRFENAGQITCSVE